MMPVDLSPGYQSEQARGRELDRLCRNMGKAGLRNTLVLCSTPAMATSVSLAFSGSEAGGHFGLDEAFRHHQYQ